MFVTTQRRQVVPKELPSLLANPFQLQPMQLGQGSAADAKKPRADIEMQKKKHSRIVSEYRTNDWAKQEHAKGANFSIPY